jgi:hypothetical protein
MYPPQKTYVRNKMHRTYTRFVEANPIVFHPSVRPSLSTYSVREAIFVIREIGLLESNSQNTLPFTIDLTGNKNTTYRASNPAFSVSTSCLLIGGTYLWRQLHGQKSVRVSQRSVALDLMTFTVPLVVHTRPFIPNISILLVFDTIDTGTFLLSINNIVIYR